MSSCFKEQKAPKVGVLICPVLWPAILPETQEPAGVALLHFFFSQTENSHTEQSREIKHGTSSLVICTTSQVNITNPEVHRYSYWLITLRGRHAYVNSIRCCLSLGNFLPFCFSDSQKT